MSNNEAKTAPSARQVYKEAEALSADLQKRFTAALAEFTRQFRADGAKGWDYVGSLQKANEHLALAMAAVCDNSACNELGVD